ncbi:MAG: OmpA family protein [Proteobacteria bacterium]|nr:OmpA family protein [Pseudomonadota bacterium]
MTPKLRAPALWALAAAVLALGLSGCAEPPKAAVAVANEVLPFEQAVAQAADGLVQQTQQTPGLLGRAARRTIVLDPMLDASTGQQTVATQLLQQRVAERMNAKAELFEILPFRVDSLARAQWLLTGTMTRVPSDRSDPARRINLALTDLKTGQVIAQTTALARDQGLDHTPLPYYRDSPVLVKDQVIDGYVRTTATKPGGPADKYYLERFAVAPVIDQATASYNAEHYQEALSGYRSALSMPAGEQLRVLNGLYLSETRLGHATEAEQAFGRVVAFGIQYDELGVKFLFNPGTTEFWSDPRISGVYPMWLRQIAREAQSAKVCMNVVGHTSRTGTEQVNDTLSLKRANVIRQRLNGEQATLTARLQSSGMGFRENIVGSGTDNAIDALDRRVEFKIVACP